MNSFNGNSSSLDKVKVLVADDEHVIADSLVAILNMSGFDARAVYDGAGAVAALESFEFDVLISDVVMPGMSGIEAANAILAQRPSCKVILFSGQATTCDLMSASEANGQHFEILAKPLHPADLLRKLRSSILPSRGDMLHMRDVKLSPKRAGSPSMLCKSRDGVGFAPNGSEFDAGSDAGGKDVSVTLVADDDLEPTILCGGSGR